MNLNKSCGTLIKQIHTTLEKNANNALRADDLTMAQISVLITLDENAEKRMLLKELEKKLHLAQSTTAGLVSRLEQKGLVESYGDPSDKRVKFVRITLEGEQCCQVAEQSMLEAEAELLSGLTETEKDFFYSLLLKVSETIN